MAILDLISRVHLASFGIMLRSRSKTDKCIHLTVLIQIKTQTLLLSFLLWYGCPCLILLRSFPCLETLCKEVPFFLTHMSPCFLLSILLKVASSFIPSTFSSSCHIIWPARYSQRKGLGRGKQEKRKYIQRTVEVER